MPVHTHPDEGMATPMIVHESPTHIVVAIEIPKASLHRHRRFIEALMQVAASREARDG
jgi:hypothetical protein